jgi:type IV secretion system protein VirD4
MPDSLLLGREWNPETGRLGRPVFSPLRSHFSLIAPPGAGKGVSLEIPNLLLGLRSSSCLSVDPSGQNAAVTAEARRRMGQLVWFLNPYRLHVDRYPDLESAGCNPLWGINPTAPLYYQHCAAVAEALIKIEGKDPHWSQSARGLIAGLVMWEVAKAYRESRDPWLEEVRRMLCEPEQRDDDGNPTAGLAFHALQMIASGHKAIADLAGRFAKLAEKGGNREYESIASTARTQTEWLLSEFMRADLRKRGVDWNQLAERPTTIFVIVPAEFLETQEGSIYLRLVTMSAIRALFARAGRVKVEKVLFLMSEFPALGKLAAAEAARSQGRKFSVRQWIVREDIHQLNSAEMYGPHGADSFAGQCEATMMFAPGDYPSAEWASQRAGEHDVIMPSASQSRGPGLRSVQISYGLQRERRWSPDKILSLAPYHGLVFFQGQGAPVPVYAEPYVDEKGRIRPQYLRAGARPDPYHSKATAPVDTVAAKAAADHRGGFSMPRVPLLERSASRALTVEDWLRRERARL